MVEQLQEALAALVPTLLGAAIALYGTLLVVRDTRKGRRQAAEQAGAAQLLAQLRAVRADPDTVRDRAARVEFEEECLAGVLAIRDRALRKRLTASVTLVAHASTNGEYLQDDTDESAGSLLFLARQDVRRCLEARLDGERAPEPVPRWTRAVEAYEGHELRVEDRMRRDEEEGERRRRARAAGE
ncbi:hypothetical protein [Streptomyces sp. NPDC054784]